MKCAWDIEVGRLDEAVWDRAAVVASSFEGAVIKAERMAKDASTPHMTCCVLSVSRKCVIDA